MDSFSKIVVLDNEVQAQILASLLEEAGIPHRMRSYHDSALNGLFQGTKGWGHVDAPIQFREQILELLERVNQAGELNDKQDEPE
ncbi:MAG: hypothetical protein ISR91_04200 [Candidatus Delongbacteria bacterium]|nr:hypothetical protein [Candidatus Delongbacteria bacterium]